MVFKFLVIIKSKIYKEFLEYHWKYPKIPDFAELQLKVYKLRLKIENYR